MVALRGQDSALAEEELLNDYDDDVEESETESDEEVRRSEPAKNYINNKEALLERLGDIAWPEHVKWIDKLTIDHNPEQEIDANDDLIRESAFYTQALAGTRQAFEKLQSMGVPFLRPPDYYAEMVKSDTHMLKVKSNLLVEKKKIEEAEERKKARESKKLAKEVQVQKTKERVKRKKDEIDSVKKWRKQRQQSGFSKDNDDEMKMPLDVGDGDGGFNKSKKRRTGVAPGDRSGGFVRRGDKNKKRDRRESKFGHGGRKGLSKQNTADSTNDFRAFNKNKFSRNKGGMKK